MQSKTVSRESHRHSHLAGTLPRQPCALRPRLAGTGRQNAWLRMWFPNSQGEAQWALHPGVCTGRPALSCLGGMWGRNPCQGQGEHPEPGPGKIQEFLERGHACLIPLGPAASGLEISWERGLVSGLSGLRSRSQDPSTPGGSCFLLSRGNKEEKVSLSPPAKGNRNPRLPPSNTTPFLKATLETGTLGPATTYTQTFFFFLFLDKSFFLPKLYTTKISLGRRWCWRWGTKYRMWPVYIAITLLYCHR